MLTYTHTALQPLAAEAERQEHPPLGDAIAAKVETTRDLVVSERPEGALHRVRGKYGVRYSFDCHYGLSKKDLQTTSTRLL